MLFNPNNKTVLLSVKTLELIRVLFTIPHQIPIKLLVINQTTLIRKININPKLSHYSVQQKVET